MTKRKIVWFLALTLLALAVQPGLAAAQTAVLYEVTESMKLTNLQQAIYRTAYATLFGTVAAGSSICPTWLVQALSQTQCTISVMAIDNVNLATGNGPVYGRFHILIPGDNPVDGAELVIAEGSLHGRVDLSPAVLAQLPLGSIEGSWSAQGLPSGPLASLSVRGTFTGTFRLPFISPQDPTKTPLYLMDPTTQQVVPLHWTQYAVGVPTVMLEIKFVEVSVGATELSGDSSEKRRGKSRSSR